MTGDDVGGMAKRIEAAVRATAGVTGLYAAGPAVSQVIGAGAHGLGVRPARTSLVQVRRSAGTTRVGIALGVGAASGARTTTRAVHQAVRDLLTTHGVGDAHITISVVHVAEPDPV